jgi:hypothetical protein
MECNVIYDDDFRAKHRSHTSCGSRLEWCKEDIGESLPDTIQHVLAVALKTAIRSGTVLCPIAYGGRIYCRLLVQTGLHFPILRNSRNDLTGSLATFDVKPIFHSNSPTNAIST